MAGPLAKYVSAFVDTIDGDLAALAGESHRDDCLREASDLISALLDADGRLSDAELRAWLDGRRHRCSTPPVIVDAAATRARARCCHGHGRLARTAEHAVRPAA